MAGSIHSQDDGGTAIQGQIDSRVFGLTVGLLSCDQDWWAEGSHANTFFCSLDLRHLAV
jgi:hypothetical protein